MLVAIGCTAGFLVASNAYPMWTSPEIKMCVTSIVCAVTLLALILQCGILVFRLKRMDVYEFLSEERE
jgi:hypothetical protein